MINHTYDKKCHVLDTIIQSNSQQGLMDGETLFTETASISGVSSDNLRIFCRSNGTASAVVKLYRLQIYDMNNSEALIRGFVPVKDSNNVVGLYDLVIDVFYDNDGSGSFTAGNEIAEAAILAVYLKVSGT